MAKSAEPERPRRLSLSQVLELVLTRETPSHSSVRLSSTAKGDTTIDVDLRVGDTAELATVAQTEALAREVYDRLRATYGQAEAGESSTVSLTRNAKGDTQIDVQVRTGDAGAVQTVTDAEAAARETFERLRAKYPMANGKTTRTPDAT